MENLLEMSWSEFLDSELVKTITFIASGLSILVLIGAAIRAIYRFVRKSVLPWEAWVIVLMLVGVGVIVMIYSRSPWMSAIVSWMIAIMLELNSRIYQRFIDRAHATTAEAVEQSKETIWYAKEANKRTRKLLTHIEGVGDYIEELDKLTKGGNDDDEGGKSLRENQR